MGVFRRAMTAAAQLWWLAEADEVRSILGDKNASLWDGRKASLIGQSVDDVLVLSFTLLALAKYHGAETIKTRYMAHDWSIAGTADHFQLCLRRRELILWACHDILNPIPALEDSVREYQAMMMPWLVKSKEVGIFIPFDFWYRCGSTGGYHSLRTLP